MVLGRGKGATIRFVYLLILLILLPVVFLGAAIARILLLPVTAPDSYDALRAHFDREIPALMQTHGVPGVAMALIHEAAS